MSITLVFMAIITTNMSSPLVFIAIIRQQHVVPPCFYGYYSTNIFPLVFMAIISQQYVVPRVYG